MEGCSDNDWTRTKTSELIELYRSREVLWNPKDRNYKDKNLKNYAWSEIAAQLQVEKCEAQNKMKNLITCFQREAKKEKSGAGTSQSVKWWAFESLLFLKDKSTPRNITEAGISGNEETINGQDGSEHTENEQGDQPVINELPATPATSRCSSSSFKPINNNPPGRKRKLNPVVQKAFDTMQRLEMKSFAERDEFKIFGEYVGHQIKKIRNERERSILKHKISTLLFEAELAQADDSSRPVSAQSMDLPPPLYESENSTLNEMLSESILEHSDSCEDSENTEISMCVEKSFFKL